MHINIQRSTLLCAPALTTSLTALPEEQLRMLYVHDTLYILRF